MDYLGKPGSGITDGNMVALGSYDGCEKMMNSHYCFARLNISGIAAQIPVSCTYYIDIEGQIYTARGGY